MWLLFSVQLSLHFADVAINYGWVKLSWPPCFYIASLMSNPDMTMLLSGTSVYRAQSIWAFWYIIIGGRGLGLGIPRGAFGVSRHPDLILMILIWFLLVFPTLFRLGMCHSDAHLTPVFNRWKQSAYHTTLILHTISLCNVGGTEQITDFMSYQRQACLPTSVSRPPDSSDANILQPRYCSLYLHTSCFTFLSLFDKDKPRRPKYPKRPHRNRVLP